MSNNKVEKWITTHEIAKFYANSEPHINIRNTEQLKELRSKPSKKGKNRFLLRNSRVNNLADLARLSLKFGKSNLNKQDPLNKLLSRLQNEALQQALPPQSNIGKRKNSMKSFATMSSRSINSLPEMSPNFLSSRLTSKTKQDIFNDSPEDS
jgi:hypothetical protein